MRNIALTLKYLGTAYHGWQVQKTVTTVGQTLEEAAAAVVGHPVHMTGCGRTDAGVHARVYVANFRTSARIPCDRIPYALNTHLPEDIVVTDAMEVQEPIALKSSCTSIASVTTISSGKCVLSAYGMRSHGMRAEVRKLAT